MCTQLIFFFFKLATPQPRPPPPIHTHPQKPHHGGSPSASTAIHLHSRQWCWRPVHYRTANLTTATETEDPSFGALPFRGTKRATSVFRQRFHVTSATSPGPAICWLRWRERASRYDISFVNHLSKKFLFLNHRYACAFTVAQVCDLYHSTWLFCGTVS